MVYTQQQQELHRLSYCQEHHGDYHRFSERLSDDFLCSAEHKNLLSQITRPQEKILYVLNWVWANPGHCPVMPENYDTYVFLQYREPVDWSWFDSFCAAHKNQKIVLLAQVKFIDDSKKTHVPKNLHLIEYQHWHYRVSRSLIDYEKDYKFSWPRPCRISSLTSKPNFFKTLITAYLHKNYAQRSDLLLSWNGNPRKEICGSMKSLDCEHMRPAIDELCSYYHSVLKNISMVLGEHGIPGHYNDGNWQDTHAFKDSVINLTNETYSPGQQNGRVYPGPLFTEKTRKAIVAGCAIVPVGMPYSYAQLERFGFKFDYPWSLDFDQTLGDLDRTEKIFQVIDEIMSYDLVWLQQQIKECTEYNYYYVRDTAFITHMQSINQQAVENYQKEHL